MRHFSRCFPNGVRVYEERLTNGRVDYTAEKNGKRIGSYQTDRLRHRRSGGVLGGRGFSDFYRWLGAAREVKR